MPRSNRVFARIAAASDKEQLEDYLAEVRYALIFCGLGFEVTIEPGGNKGPDLSISRDGHSAVVEIMRFRKVYSGPPSGSADEDFLLLEYGNPGRDTRKAFEKILRKFSRVDGKRAVIAVWNDDGDLEELEVEAAVKDLGEDASRGVLSLPFDLLSVLYGSRWLNVTGGKQLYCFPFCQRDRLDHIRRWQREFETARLDDVIARALAPHNEG